MVRRRWLTVLLTSLGAMIGCSHASAVTLSITHGLPGQVVKKDTQAVVLLAGDIESGDAARFEDFLFDHSGENGEITGRVTVLLNSPGGDVEEAMKLAAVLRELMATVVVFQPHRCASACFLLYVDAPIRFADPAALAVHRPFLPRDRVQKLNAAEAAKLHNSIYETTRKWLQDRFVPQTLIDKMLSASSADAYWLTASDVASLGRRAPWYEEWLLARCPDVDRVEEAYLRTKSKQERDQFEPLLTKQRHCEFDALDNQITIGALQVFARAVLRRPSH